MFFAEVGDTAGVGEEATTALGSAAVADGVEPKPRAPKLAPTAIVNERRLIEIALAAATAVFLCITRPFRSRGRALSPGFQDCSVDPGREGPSAASVKCP